MASGGPDPDAVETVDARGLRCPLPVIRLAVRAAALPGGTLLTVVSTDPAARHDVPAWARMRGHELVATEHRGNKRSDEWGDEWAITVRLSNR